MKQGWFLINFQLLDEKGVIWKDKCKAATLEEALECIKETKTLDCRIIDLEVKYPYFEESDRVWTYK